MNDTIKDVIEKRLALHINDDFALHECWEKETEILSKNVSTTIDYILNSCDDETFYWLSEVFEDVAGKTSSKDLINAFATRCESVSDAEKRRSIESEIVAANEAL